MFLQVILQGRCGLPAFLEGDERREGLALQVVRAADHRRLSHSWVVDQRTLHFHGSDSVSGYVEHVVHASQDPPIASLIDLGAISRKVPTRKAAPVGLLVTLVIPVNRAE